MKHLLVLATPAMAVSLGLAGLTGCGGGPSAQITTPPASITSFDASLATITDGSSATLTGVFANGTGAITPGNLAVTSGVAVTVSPTATTTYTLTVTPSSGAAVTATATITVNPAPPTITSFLASPPTITDGSSATLTGVFANGTGVIAPGNIAATSGVAVTVSPTTTTTYTLTVTPASGTAVTATATITVNPPPPTIASFLASPPTITDGSSATLTGVFANGTGVITPGNLPATSTVPVTVSPTTTTTYTLTVTGPGGSPVTATAKVTVNPAPPPPTITSFLASSPTITDGTSTTLTGVFANGTGVITPGSLPATSGVAVTVSPTATTTYTLTVTPPSGTAVTATAKVTVQSTVVVNLVSTGPAVTDKLLGMNLAAWYDEVGNATAVNDAFALGGIQAIRWPGGSWSDEYHWETPNSSSDPSLPFMCENNSNGVPNGTTGWGGYSTFAEFVTSIVQGGSYDLALTADYGTDPACTGPGDPTEAAAWVAAAVTDGIHVSHVTVGNEEYGTWETDLHTAPHDGATYAAAVAGASGYYSLIKAADASTLAGVDVEPDYAPWDQDVMSGAKGSYDFVEYHYYPQGPFQETDSFLVNQAAQDLTANLNTIKTELTNWGTPNTPIYVGEMGSVYTNPGKQSWSITQGLYAGQMLGEMMNAGVSRATWWIGFGNCNGDNGNDSSSLYGWQNFGAYNVFADGAGDTGGTNNTPCDYGAPIGTMSPTARAFQLFSQMAVNNEKVLSASVAGNTTDVVAYAATHSGGTALVLFNRNETTPQQVVVTLSGKGSSSSVNVTTYDKAIYDLSGSPTGNPPDPSGTSTWAAPTATSLGTQTLPLTLTLTPWSMNVVIIQ